MASQILNQATNWIADQREGFSVELFVHLEGETQGAWVRAISIQEADGTVEIDGETTEMFPKKMKQICPTEAVKSARLKEGFKLDDDLPGWGR